jgi:hypothetical protein
MLRFGFQSSGDTGGHMNGYGKHSRDYGGPSVGWGTIVLAVALLIALAGVVAWLSWTT